MKKEDILEASRKEHKNRDMAELEIHRYAAGIAVSVGACICAVISLLASTMTNSMLYSPWVIYSSMLGTTWLVKGIKLKKKSHIIVAAVFAVLAILAFVGLIKRLAEGRL